MEKILTLLGDSVYCLKNRLKLDLEIHFSYFVSL